MTRTRITLNPYLNKHEFNHEIRRWITPSFPKYYEFGPEERNEKKKKISDISEKLQERIEG